MKLKKTCLNCGWCPAFTWFVPPNPQYSSWRGKCRFPSDAKTLRKMKAPQGAQLSAPWIDRDKPKQNCPAWEVKP